MATDLTAPDMTEPLERDSLVAPSRRRRPVLYAAAAAVAAGTVGITALLAPGTDAPRDALRAEGVAPSFDLPAVAAPDERVTLEAFAGRPVVVNFWASWCVPCRKEMPALQAVAARVAGRVGFVGINHQDTAADAAAFERSVGVSYPSGYDPDGGVAREFGVMGLPTTVLVDANGRIVGRRLGEVTEAELLDLLEAAFGPDVLGPPR